MAVCAIIAANRRMIPVVVLWYFPLVAVAAATLFFSFGRFVGRSIRGRFWHLSFLVAFVLGLLVVVLGLWSGHRMLAVFDDPQWPRPWPYPDTALASLHDWFDARHPVSPGMLKLRGEIYRVVLLFNSIVLVALAWGGTFLGMMTARHQIPWRILYRRVMDRCIRS
jgi:hypothetical protein